MSDDNLDYTLGQLNGLKLYADALHDRGILNNDDYADLVSWILQIDTEYREKKYPQYRLNEVLC